MYVRITHKSLGHWMISLVEKDQRCRISILKIILNRQDLSSGSVFFNMATMEDLKNMGKEILKLTTDD